jgi:general stress protein CsbA
MLRATILLIALMLVASPITFSLVTYIDYVGIDLMLVLLEAQIAFGVAFLLRNVWAPVRRKPNT